MPENEKKSSEVVGAGGVMVLLRDGAIVMEIAHLGYVEMGPNEATQLVQALQRAVKLHQEGGPVTDATRID